MISTRHAGPLFVALVIALVPVVTHSYLRREVDDGWRSAALPSELLGQGSRPSERAATWGQRRFKTDDWVERWSGGAHPLRVTVVRTFDAKSVYHHPELAVSYPEASLGAPTRVALPAGTATALQGMDQSRDLVFYALIANGQVVDNPYTHQARLALEMLFTGRRAMTLVYVHDRQPPGVALEQQPALRLLAEAIVTLQRGAHQVDP